MKTEIESENNNSVDAVVFGSAREISRRLREALPDLKEAEPYIDTDYFDNFGRVHYNRGKYDYYLTWNFGVSLIFISFGKRRDACNFMHSPFHTRITSVPMQDPASLDKVVDYGVRWLLGYKERRSWAGDEPTGL